MYDVIGVNVFARKLMKFPRKEKVNSVPYPLLTNNFTTYFIVISQWIYSLCLIYNLILYC